jgi:demethylmenaquinone methyltransferase/2-methoxy-6-polyprenyl-1,4-benzoquinol methylase
MTQVEMPPPTAMEVRPGSGEMFDRIAQRYDLLNRVLSFGIDRGWRRQAARALGAARRVLDLATGTGDLALEIARQLRDAEVVGSDPSEAMLEVGRQKIAARGLSARIAMTQGDAQHIAHPDGSFDGVTIAFGIRNVPDRERALREMARVTRDGGRVVILELTEPRSGLMAPLARFHVHWLVPRLGALLSGAREYRYLEKSIARFPSAQEFAATMAGCNLEMLEVRPLTFGTAHLFIATPSRPHAKVVEA